MATSVTMVPSVFDGRKARAGPTLAVPLTKAAAHPAPPRNTAPPPFFAHGREKLLSVHLGDQTTVFSTQVLQEYFVAATRIGLPAELAQRHVATDAQANIVQVTTELILAAIDLHRLHRLSFRDALIVRSARAGGCSVVLSEDRTHGETYEGVRVESPFIR